MLQSYSLHIRTCERHEDTRSWHTFGDYDSVREAEVCHAYSLNACHALVAHALHALLLPDIVITRWVLLI